MMSILSTIDLGNKKYAIGEEHFYIFDIAGHELDRFPLQLVGSGGGLNNGEYFDYTFYFPNSDKIIFSKEPNLTDFVNAFHNQKAKYI
ncbi:hypothetical protein [Paenibacillus sp. NPDC058177]|uniref:hypothetical protein n=1 Tax=Paenibacillus sp. NPDC058177 TaxID=3346369 RepID=UPI0036D89D0C